MVRTLAELALRITHDQRQALGAGRQVGPAQRRRDVLARAILVRGVLAAVLAVDDAVVSKRGRLKGEDAGLGMRSRHGRQACE